MNLKKYFLKKFGKKNNNNDIMIENAFYNHPDTHRLELLEWVD